MYIFFPPELIKLFVIDRKKKCLEDFKAGFATYGLLDLMKKIGELFKEILTLDESDDLTTEKVYNTFRKIVTEEEAEIQTGIFDFFLKCLKSLESK